MYKIILTFFLAVTLNAQLVDGVSITVKGEIITLYDVKKEMQITMIDAKKASNILIRKKLELLEIKKRKIKVSATEVYEDIKRTAESNNLSVSDFYEVIRDSSGLTSTELKEKIKEKLLSEKLYNAVSYSALKEPSSDEINEYYQLHKDKFKNPEKFKAIIYKSKNKARLIEKIENPMFYSPDISSEEQELFYNKISPTLALLLKKTALNSFSTIVPDGKGSFLSFYIKEISKPKQKPLQKVKNQVINMMLEDKREQVLSDYFARLRHNADIKIIRLPE